MYGQMQTYMYNAQGIPEQPLKPQTRLLYRGIMNAQALLVRKGKCSTLYDLSVHGQSLLQTLNSFSKAKRVAAGYQIITKEAIYTVKRPLASDQKAQNINYVNKLQYSFRHQIYVEPYANL